jgi:hypothetical protein
VSDGEDREPQWHRARWEARGEESRNILIRQYGPSVALSGMAIQKS